MALPRCGWCAGLGAPGRLLLVFFCKADAQLDADDCYSGEEGAEIELQDHVSGLREYTPITYIRGKEAAVGRFAHESKRNLYS